MKTDKASLPYVISRYFRIYLPGERGFSSNTISSYRDTFRQLLGFIRDTDGISPEKLQMSELSRNTIIGFLAKLEHDGKSISTRNQRLAAIKSFFGFVKYEYPEYLTNAHDILAIHMKKQPLPIVSYMPPEAVGCLLRQPDATKKSGYRDMLILTLMYDSAARVSEITQVRVGDIRTQRPAAIVLHGKGQKDRAVPLSEKTADLIQVYLDKEQLVKPECANNLLFVNHSARQLTREGISYIVKKYTTLARKINPDIIPEQFSPHCLRHSKAMHLLQAGVALIYIRDILGHASVTTTEIYAKVDSQGKRRALETAYSDIPIPDSVPTNSWNSDSSLMKFLQELCDG